MAILSGRRFSVAAGILPAVEPGRPARRRDPSHTPTGLEYFRTALRRHCSFPGGGTHALHGKRDVRRYNAFATSSRACRIKSRSSARLPKRNFGSPLCSRPSSSPGPRKARSASAMRKPSFVSSSTFKRSLAPAVFASEIKTHYDSCAPPAAPKLPGGGGRPMRPRNW